MVDLRGIGELMIGATTVWTAITATLAHRNTRTPNGKPSLGQTATNTAQEATKAAQTAAVVAARLDDTYERMITSAQESSAESKALLRFLEQVAERRTVPVSPRKEEA